MILGQFGMPARCRHWCGQLLPVSLVTVTAWHARTHMHKSKLQSMSVECTMVTGQSVVFELKQWLHYIVTMCPEVIVQTHCFVRWSTSY